MAVTGHADDSFVSFSLFLFVASVFQCSSTFMLYYVLGLCFSVSVNIFYIFAVVILVVFVLAVVVVVVVGVGDDYLDDAAYLLCCSSCCCC